VKLATSLTIALDNSVARAQVAGFSERRGDATAARCWYEDLHGRRRITICLKPTWAGKNRLEITLRGRSAPLAAAHFLRYATQKN